ncbi:hypothetical protein AAHN97_16145 [Chitinophaga niabensis]|uniref:hypothetical protein n=1 Tax=Chitinophaga niabensis TaxID=536979 RepID=UPI0031BB4290
MVTKQPNYIQHLNGFIKVSKNDKRLTGNHISLYLALFITWNDNFFSKSFKINRSGLISISHIGSHHTYRKCVADLDKFGYIKYAKSTTKGKASSITLVPIEEIKPGKNAPLTGADLPADTGKNAPSTEANVPPIKNNINSLNKERGTLPPDNQQNENRKPENLQDVLAFFHLLGQPESEAARFFHHYEANDWKQGSGIPIVKWPDAARKWILNINPIQTLKNGKRKQGTGTAPGTLHTNQNKSYSDPL